MRSLSLQSAALVAAMLFPAVAASSWFYRSPEVKFQDAEVVLQGTVVFVRQSKDTTIYVEGSAGERIPSNLPMVIYEIEVGEVFKGKEKNRFIDVYSLGNLSRSFSVAGVSLELDVGAEVVLFLYIDAGNGEYWPDEGTQAVYFKTTGDDHSPLKPLEHWSRELDADQQTAAVLTLQSLRKLAKCCG